MTDKPQPVGEMPDEIWACVDKDGAHWVDQCPVWGKSTKYTRAHPDQPSDESRALSVVDLTEEIWEHFFGPDGVTINCSRGSLMEILCYLDNQELLKGAQKPAAADLDRTELKEAIENIEINYSGVKTDSNMTHWYVDTVNADRLVIILNAAHGYLTQPRGGE